MQFFNYTNPWNAPLMERVIYCILCIYIYISLSLSLFLSIAFRLGLIIPHVSLLNPKFDGFSMFFFSKTPRKSIHGRGTVVIHQRLLQNGISRWATRELSQPRGVPATDRYRCVAVLRAMCHVPNHVHFEHSGFHEIQSLHVFVTFICFAWCKLSFIDNW